MYVQRENMQYIMASSVEEARTDFPSSDFFIRRVIGVIVLLSRFLSSALLTALPCCIIDYGIAFL